MSLLGAEQANMRLPCGYKGANQHPAPSRTESDRSPEEFHASAALSRPHTHDLPIVDLYYYEVKPLIRSALASCQHGPRRVNVHHSQTNTTCKHTGNHSIFYLLVQRLRCVAYTKPSTPRLTHKMESNDISIPKKQRQACNNGYRYTTRSNLHDDASADLA